LKTKIVQKKLVRKLRKEGSSYREILEQVKVSKSSLSLWCKDICLTNSQLMRLSTKRPIKNYGAEANHRNRQAEIKRIRTLAKKEIGNISNQEFKLMGIALYWAEGSKTKNAEVSNSDPKIIKFMVKWFEKFCSVKPIKLKAQLHVHSGQDEVRMKKYWSVLTGIPLNNFCKSYIKPEGTGHRKNILYNGTIKIRFCSENLRHRILGWIEEASKKIDMGH